MINRSYVKKGVLKNFTMLTGKHLCWSLFSLNAPAWVFRSEVLKKRLQHSCFPVNIVKFLKNPILKNIYERLLLDEPFLWNWLTISTKKQHLRCLIGSQIPHCMRLQNTSLYEIPKYWTFAEQINGASVKKELNNYTLPIDHIMFRKI